MSDSSSSDSELENYFDKKKKTSEYYSSSKSSSESSSESSSDQPTKKKKSINKFDEDDMMDALETSSDESDYGSDYGSEETKFEEYETIEEHIETTELPFVKKIPEEKKSELVIEDEPPKSEKHEGIEPPPDPYALKEPEIIVESETESKTESKKEPEIIVKSETESKTESENIGKIKKMITSRFKKEGNGIELTIKGKIYDFYKLDKNGDIPIHRKEDDFLMFFNPETGYIYKPEIIKEEDETKAFFEKARKVLDDCLEYAIEKETKKEPKIIAEKKSETTEMSEIKKEPKKFDIIKFKSLETIYDAEKTEDGKIKIHSDKEAFDIILNPDDSIIITPSDLNTEDNKKIAEKIVSDYKEKIINDEKMVNALNEEMKKLKINGTIKQDDVGKYEIMLLTSGEIKKEDEPDTKMGKIFEKLIDHPPRFGAMYKKQKIEIELSYNFVDGD